MTDLSTGACLLSSSLSTCGFGETPPGATQGADHNLYQRNGLHLNDSNFGHDALIIRLELRCTCTLSNIAFHAGWPHFQASMQKDQRWRAQYSLVLCLAAQSRTFRRDKETVPWKHTYRTYLNTRWHYGSLKPQNVPHIVTPAR